MDDQPTFDLNWLRPNSPDDLRIKAQECRVDAESFTIPELRAHLLEIAGEYERLASRS